MVRTVKNDLDKIFRSYHIYLCILAWGSIYTFSCWKYLSEQIYIGTLVNQLEYMFGDAVSLYCFLACVIGGSFLYCAEEKHRYLQFEIQRIGVKKYAGSKLCVSYIGGFLVVLLGTIQTVLLIYLLFYSGIEDWTSIWGSMADIQAFVWTVLGRCMMCGMLSAMGYLTAVFYANFYVAMTVPIIAYYAFLVSAAFISIPQHIQFQKVYLYMDSSGKLIYACMYSLCLLIIFYRIAVYGTQRRLEHA